MKKFIALFTIMVLLFGIMVPTGLSAEAPTPIDLKKAIEIGKNNFDFDTTGMDFNSSYSEYNGRNIWSLNWNTNKAPYKSINISVDANTGDILNMNYWDDNQQTVNSKFPKYTREEAIKAASEFAMKMQPEKFKFTKEYTDPNFRLYGDIYYGNVYRISFVRYIKDIPFIDNNIVVSVNKNTLKISGFEYNWDSSNIPDSSKAITKEKAMQIFKEKLGLELRYNMIYDQKLHKNVPILVYSTKTPVRPIDALTGEVLNQQIFYGEPRMAEAMKSSKAMDQVVITPQEQNIIDNSKNYITKEAAILAVKKYLVIPKGYTFENANMYSTMVNNNATWNLSWNFNDKTNNKYGYISAGINAITGELMSFYKGGTDIDTPSSTINKYNKDNAKVLAEKFIEKIQPGMLKQVEYRDNLYDSIPVDSKQVMQNYNFMRKTNGIPVNGEGFNVNVSLKTGEITGYNKTWSNEKFPEVNAKITLDQAYETYFAKLNFQLRYFRFYDYSKTYNNGVPQVKLAYTLETTGENIDPITGDLLDYNGNPIKPANSLIFTDIKGHKYENDIKMLVDSKIIPVDSEKFMPDESVLQKDFIMMLMKALEPVVSYPIAASNEKYDQYYQQAINKNILSAKDKNPDAAVKKQDMAKMLVRAYGVGFVADMSNIYKLSFKDADKIAKSYIGYITIANELKLFETENECFNPEMNLTKAETASTLVKFMKVDTNSIE